MKDERVPGTTQYVFQSSESLSTKQIANYIGKKLRKMRDQKSRMFNESESTACCSVDDQQYTLGDQDERESVRDPVFYSTEEELLAH